MDCFTGTVHGVSCRLSPAYRRNRLERMVLYAIVAEHYPSYIEAIETSDGQLPVFVRQEFDDYLKCGLTDNFIVAAERYLLAFDFN